MPDHNHEAPPTGGTGGAQPAGSAPTTIDPALRRLAITVVLGAIMAILDTTIVSVAIDTLGRDFHTSLSTISWVTTGYLLALAVVIPLTGWAVERFGATRMWNLSLTLFVLGSALCGLSWSAGSLIFFRILQGLGGGMIMPICMTLLARAAGPARVGRIMSIVGVPSLLAPILGPVVGGLIVDDLSWRWIFFVNLPVGIIALIASARVLPRGDRGQAEMRLDVPGFLLISPGLAGLVYGLSEAGTEGGFGAAKVQISIAAGAVLLVGFVVHALRRQDALLDLRLFRDRVFTVAGVATFTIGAILFGAMFLLPLYYQVVRGQSALHAGLLMAPQGVGAMIAMAIAGRISDRHGAGTIVPAGLALCLVATLAFTQVDAHTSQTVLAIALFARGLGFGAAMMPTMGAAYQTLTPSAIPRATTTLNILQRVGGSLATALVAVELQRSISGDFGVSSGSPLEASGGSRLPEPVAQIIGHAFGSTYWWIVGLTGVGLVFSLFLPRHAPAVAGEVGEAGPAAAADPADAPTPEPVG